MHILMLHGIYHNLFGRRDTAQYGSVTLDQINASLSVLGTDPTCFQSSNSRLRCERLIF